MWTGMVLREVDDSATNENLEYALKTWAPGADNLFIYLAGHGHKGEFEIEEWETLSAGDFDAWLDAAQTTIPDFVAIVYDACRSGSFYPIYRRPLEKQGYLPASAGPNENAVFMVEGSLSFGYQFFTELGNGATFKDSFTRARNSIQIAYDLDQNPGIEGDWDVTGLEKKDLEIAAGIKVGLEKPIAGGIPRIESACPPQTLPEGVSEASVYATNVIGEGITEVFAVIKPPDYVSGSPDDPVVNLPKIQLPPLGNRYQGTYDGFTSAGTYNIAIFAINEKGYLSLPLQTTVTTYSPCLRIADDVSIQIPCVEYQGNQYAVTLQYYQNLNDFLGYYWKLGSAVPTEASGCLHIGSDLSIPISCAQYGVAKYGFTLLFYPNPSDSSGCTGRWIRVRWWGNSGQERLHKILCFRTGRTHRSAPTGMCRIKMVVG